MVMTCVCEGVVLNRLQLMSVFLGGGVSVVRRRRVHKGHEEKKWFHSHEHRLFIRCRHVGKS